MKKEEIGKLAIELIQAEIDGKTVQYSDKGEDCWEDLSVISALGANAVYSGYHDFRIKPEKKLIPFTWEDREKLIGKYVKSKNGNIITSINGLMKEGNGNIRINLFFNTVENWSLLEGYTFLDGSPCGKEVEE